MKVVVLMGGVSPERNVSLKSGKAVAAALREVGIYDVREVVMEEDLPRKDDVAGADVIFLALHGGSGEDGRVQAALEEMGVVYTGSGPEASRRAMEKVLSKRLFMRAGIPTPPFLLLERGEKGWRGEEMVFDAGHARVVKPVACGSTVGVGILRGRNRFRDEVFGEAFRHDKRVIVEDFVEGRELTVGILGEVTLPVIEIVPEDGFYSYEAKYSSASTRYVVDVDLPAETRKRIGDVALRAHEVLGCRDVSRVDIRLDDEGTPFVLEVNTIPGMTERSLFPMAARAAGISFPSLVDRIVRMAISRKGGG